ncbi:Putative periplasmic protein [Salmonella enterica subsp. salamae]|uniref:Periplasmic protein n=2 Tax=Enterobacteriaceae TaxID=543 RepID=A0A6D2G8R2_SALER|nr:Putative periplasmic protein [Salmonella enterica subsp. salamae]
MFQLKPGALAIVIGAKTPAGRRNIGKSVELFCLCQPGDEFINPVNGHVTLLPKEAPRALWLVTGDVASADGQHGFAWGARRTFAAVVPGQPARPGGDPTITVLVATPPAQWHGSGEYLWRRIATSAVGVGQYPPAVYLLDAVARVLPCIAARSG